jgi:flavorubredoxin
MKNSFKAVRVTDRVYWVGAIDWSVRDFHGYLTGRGTTYNAYLVLGEKIALIDTVRAGFQNEMLARIASVIEPEQIDYIISNHAEPDHSGSLAETIKVIQPEKTFASAMGVAALDEHFGLGGVGGLVTPVKDGQDLDLGGVRLSFHETRMCHWPDSMVTYVHEDKLLLSQDAFGMHLASYERFDDELDERLLEDEAARYYANILLPLSSFVEKALAKLGGLGAEFRIIAPDHGPIWRKDPGKIVQLYSRWAAQRRTNKAVVVYDTMWKSTDLMARAVGEGLAAGGARARLLPMSGTHRSDVAAEILDAGALVVGAPTLNNAMFPTVADVLNYIGGLRPKGLIGAAFGSYGWSGESPKDVREALEAMKVELVGEPLRVKYVPDGEELKRCYDLGLQVAARLKEKLA